MFRVANRCTIISLLCIPILPSLRQCLHRPNLECPFVAVPWFECVVDIFLCLFDFGELNRVFLSRSECVTATLAGFHNEHDLTVTFWHCFDAHGQRIAAECFWLEVDFQLHRVEEFRLCVGFDWLVNLQHSFAPLGLCLHSSELRSLVNLRSWKFSPTLLASAGTPVAFATSIFYYSS